MFLLASGDFEDETPDWNEDGLQKLMVDYYGPALETTVFVLAHHGADYLANKPVLRNALKPLAVMASADTDYRCTSSFTSDAHATYMN